jgi:hypothetical protein
MANRTIAEQIAKLETRRDALEAALTKAEGGIASSSADGMSVSYSQPGHLQSELTRVEKSLQRLYRGGRGIVVDMSYGTPGMSEATT